MKHPDAQVPKVIREGGDYYVLPSSEVDEVEDRILKQGDTFAIFDRYGDMRSFGLGEQGLFHEGTRFLSRFRLRTEEKRPLLLSSLVTEDNTLLDIDLMNPDLQGESQVEVPRGKMYLSRRLFLWKGTCYQEIRLHNFGQTTARFELRIEVDADFVDLFEVRGLERKQRGQKLDPVYDKSAITLGYKGLDDVRRETKVIFSPSPTSLDDKVARFDVQLKPQEEQLLHVTASCRTGQTDVRVLSFEEGHERVRRASKTLKRQSCHIYTSNEQFNDWVNRSLSDLHMMTSETPEGLYPYAGVPWFNTAFGRDGIITALESLWVNPSIAKGVLKHLAATQATEVNPKQDAEPGKIMHETRSGEMANLGEVPFKRYYGTVDATPLFVVLAGRYVEHTGDEALLRSIWANVESALTWIDTYGDRDEDQFVEYQREAEEGLDNQGWKDSHDAVFYKDGQLAEGPIALCEVQGYVFEAKMQAAMLAEVVGQEKRAQALRHEAEKLKEKFNEAFWQEEIGTYALALDGEKRPCLVRTSNAGHCLFSGIATPDHADEMVKTLFEEDSFCDWGIRTLAKEEARFNPMSYHNGSVWPHDNALIAQGLGRYGYKDHALKLLEGLFNVSLFVEDHRLPELFCGFRRRPGKGPTLYPVACLPQSWAAASVFMLIKSCLGLHVNGSKNHLTFNHPRLPAFLRQVEVKGIKVGDGELDLTIKRRGSGIGVDVTRRTSDIEVSVLK